MTQLVDIVVTLILVGVILTSFYTFMGDIFTQAQVANIQSNFTGVDATVDKMIDTAQEIKQSTDSLEPTGLGTGFISTTINGMIIAGKAVANSLDSIVDMTTSLFRVFNIPVGNESIIYLGLLSTFTVIIVFALFKALRGGAT